MAFPRSCIVYGSTGEIYPGFAGPNVSLGMVGMASKKNKLGSFLFFHQKSLLRAGVNLSTTGNVHIFTSSWGEGDSSGNPGIAEGGWWSFTTQSSTAFEFVAAIHLAHLACPTRDSPGEEENAHPGMST